MYWLFSILLGILGVVGGIVPVLPGPPLAWCALLCAHFASAPEHKLSTAVIVIWLVAAIVITVLDYLLPGFFARLTGGHKSAERGALAGLIVGIIFTPIGMILGSFLGAFLCEYFFEERDPLRALSAAAGTFIAFILTTGVKVVYGIMALWRVGEMFINTYFC